jgi:hypothetical protein
MLLGAEDILMMEHKVLEDSTTAVWELDPGDCAIHLAYCDGVRTLAQHLLELQQKGRARDVPPVEASHKGGLDR